MNQLVPNCILQSCVIFFSLKFLLINLPFLLLKLRKKYKESPPSPGVGFAQGYDVFEAVFDRKYYEQKYV